MSKEIVMACIKYCDRLYTGFNHTECFNKLNREEMIIVHSRLEEGFVDSDGNFVDRKQAMVIAKEAGQLSFETNKKSLISEDLHLNWLKKQANKISDLEAKLAESENTACKNIAELTRIATKKDRKIEELKQQVTEKNQDKISFAVAYLELLKAFIIDKEFYFIGEDYSTVYVEDITEEIDNQIKQLKEMK